MEGIMTAVVKMLTCMSSIRSMKQLSSIFITPSYEIAQRHQVWALMDNSIFNFVMVLNEINRPGKYVLPDHLVQQQLNCASPLWFLFRYQNILTEVAIQHTQGWLSCGNIGPISSQLLIKRIQSGNILDSNCLHRPAVLTGQVIERQAKLRR